jgi:hypothetical protein
MSFLKATFGVPREERSDEFYRKNRWMGQTPAEARFLSTVRIVLATCGLVYIWLR